MASNLRKAVKSRPKGGAKAPPPEQQGPPAIQQPTPIIPESFEYVRFLSKIPGMRKAGGQS